MAKVTNVNIDCATRQSAQLLFELKTLLLANGWSIVGTSDGTTATNASSPDRVSTVALFDVSNAWYVLADPSGLAWLYVQRRASNTVATIKVSRVAPQANGTATVMPTCATASDETTLLSNLTFATTAAAARGHLITYDAAENNAGVRPVYVLMTQGTATICGGLFLEAAANGSYASGNAYPWMVGHGSSNALLTAGSSSAVWTYYYSPSSVFADRTSLSQPTGFTTGGFSTPVTGTIPSGVDPWISQDSGVPIVVGRNNTLTHPGIWGYMKNIRMRTADRSYPSTMTTSGGDRFVYAGNCIIPYANGVTPL